MASIIGISTARVSDMLISKQMLAQVQQNQFALYATETQLTTGHAFQTASEDPVSAMSVISLQSLLERKQQAASNLETTQSFLSASDSALSEVSNSMSDIRATALSVIGTSATDVQRSSAAIEVAAALSQLISTGNQTFRGRYLFAGSTTSVEPFATTSGGLVQYLGNEVALSSYCDIDSLYSSSVNGNEVFGAISETVEGTTQLSAALTDDTQLTNLNNGEGVRLGSIDIQVGSKSYAVDLSNATTIDDVAQMIYAQTNKTVKVHVGSEGLVLDASAKLTIKDVGAGKTAYDLGIVTGGTSSTHVDGKALDPILTGTTPLADLLGTRASAWIEQSGDNNDLILNATRNGASLNDVEITFVSDSSIEAHGGETVEYDADSLPKTLVVKIVNGVSTAADVVEAINKANESGDLPFTAEIDLLEGQSGGSGVVRATAAGQTAGVTSGGSGQTFDQTSGLQIVNNNPTYPIDFDEAVTVEDFLNTLNASGAGVLAEINDANDGINIRSRISGCDFCIGENGGSTATQLGLRTLTEETSLDDLNFGAGIQRACDQVTATAECVFGNDNSDLLFTATNSGSDWDGCTIVFVDNESSASADGLTYDAEAKTLTFEISEGQTTANDIVAMLGDNSIGSATFQATLLESGGIANDGSGLVTIGTWTTSRNAGTNIDFTITRADGVSFDIDLSNAETLGDVIELISQNETNCSSGSKVRAQLAAYGNGIELVDETAAGGTLTITRSNLSLAAVDLGLIAEGKKTATATTQVTVGEALVTSTNADSSLVVNARTPGDWSADVRVVFRDTGTESVAYDEDSHELTISYESGVTTAARIKEVVDADPAASAVFSVDYPTSDPPSDGSGIFDPTSSDVTMTMVSAVTLTGDDSNPQEVKGLYTAMLRLQNALENNDESEIERAIALLDDATTQLDFVRAEVGAREQSLDTLQTQLEDEDTELQNAVSLAYDADITEVVSRLALQQTVYEASMKALALISNMTLLDYL